jgi:hypothetical protein
VTTPDTESPARDLALETAAVSRTWRRDPGGRTAVCGEVLTAAVEIV